MKKGVSAYSKVKRCGSAKDESVMVLKYKITNTSFDLSAARRKAVRGMMHPQPEGGG